MTKDFIPYEQSLELKHLGFYERCMGHYWEGLFYYQTTHSHPSTMPNSIESCLAPLYQQAFRWFRDKHNLPSNLELFHIGWDYVIYLDVTEEVDFNEGPWNTYEEAELACLNRLIEIVKNK